MTNSNWHLSEDRFFDPDPTQRRVARELYAGVAGLPIISPHGHVDPRLLADENASFGTPADLFIIPDHYVFRMLYSQGVPLEALGVPRTDGGAVETDHRKIWQRFAEHYHLFRGTPSGAWLDHALVEVFGIRQKPTGANAQAVYDEIAANWRRPNSGRGRCSSASTSRCWPPPTPHPTRWRSTGRWPSPAGTAASSPPSAPTRW